MPSPHPPNSRAARLAAIAAANGGPFTAAQASACGVTPAERRRLLARGLWVSLRRQVYVPRSVLEACTDDASRHALDVAAARLCHAGDPVASRQSAARLHGLAFLVPPADVVRLDRDHSAAQRQHTGIRHIALPPHHRTRRFGVPVTTVARTVVDLARALPFRDGVVLADSALRATGRGADPGRGLRRELAEVVRFCAGWPGITRAQRVVAFADGRAESAAESLGRVVFHEQGLPAPVLQAVLGDETFAYARVDFYFAAYATVVEVDGLLKYDASPQAGGLNALQREKLRQERLEEMGLQVVRATWRQLLDEPERVAARTWAAFGRAALRPLPDIVVWEGQAPFYAA